MNLGRVVEVNFGEHAGKVAVVVDIVDEKRVIIVNPLEQIPRHQISNKRLGLTKFRVATIEKDDKQSVIEQKLKEFKLADKIKKTSFGKRIMKQKARS